MLVLAAGAAALGGREAGIPVEPVGWIAVFIAISLALLRGRRSRGRRLGPSLIDEAAGIVMVTATAAMVVVALRVLLESDANAARQTVRLWAFGAVYLSAGRIGLALADRRAHRHGEDLANVVIVGGGLVGRGIAQRLLDIPELGLRPVGFVDKEPIASGVADDLPVLGASWDLERVIVDHRVSHAVISFSTAPHHVMLDVTRRCHALGVEVLMVPRLFEGVNNRMFVEHLGGLPLLAVRPVDPRGAAFAVKHVFDRVVASVLFALALPVLAASALAMRLSSPGPVLFHQPRVGRDGREFELLKLRTMTGSPRDAGEADRVWAARALDAVGSDDDSAEPAPDRTTRVGRFLRRYSLDELPQLWNVVRGEMSLVGPRPERTQYVRMFTDAVYRYDDRLRVKSGITGWAQVHGLRGATSLDDRIEWDNYYIENWSLWLDLKILLMTAHVFYRGSGS